MYEQPSYETYQLLLTDCCCDITSGRVHPSVAIGWIHLPVGTVHCDGSRGGDVRQHLDGLSRD